MARHSTVQHSPLQRSIMHAVQYRAVNMVHNYNIVHRCMERFFNFLFGGALSLGFSLLALPFYFSLRLSMHHQEDGSCPGDATVDQCDQGSCPQQWGRISGEPSVIGGFGLFSSISCETLKVGIALSSLLAPETPLWVGGARPFVKWMAAFSCSSYFKKLRSWV